MSNRRELRGNGKCKHSVKSNRIWELMYSRLVSFLWETTQIIYVLRIRFKFNFDLTLLSLFKICKQCMASICIALLIIHFESENRTWTTQECFLCVNSQLSKMMSRGSTLSQRDFFRISRSCSLVTAIVYWYGFRSPFCDMFMSSKEFTTPTSKRGM